MKKVVLILCLALSAAFVFAQLNTTENLSFDLDVSSRVQIALSSSDYKVTAGDAYQLTYAVGSTSVSYPIIVDSTYQIRVANLAVIDASGKTFLALKRQVEDIVTRNYPMSGVQFTLVTPASFYVKLEGEVTKTAEKKAWALSRLSTLLGDSLTSLSSKRDITITSANGDVRTYDLFRATRFGELSQDPYVRPGDVITISKIRRVVTISGEVERPGTYELMKNENLAALISYYGSGLTELADTSRITITRDRGSADPSGNVMYLDQAAIKSDLALNNGDHISIGSKGDLLPSIIVEGIINNPRPNADGADTLVDKNSPKDAQFRTSVKFHVGEDYAPFVRRISSMYTSYSDLKNAYIERNGTKIPLDIEEYLYDWTKSKSGIAVEANDTLFIPYSQHFEKILVNGEVTSVHEEDAWPLRRISTIIGDNLTAYSSTRNVMVTGVDGVTATYDLFKFSRDGDLTQNPYVREGETVTVQRMERKVTIEGTVERTGTYQLLKGENLKALIEYYGNGLTELADTSRITLTRNRESDDPAGNVIYLDQSAIDSDIALYNGDRISIGSLADLVPSIIVEGIINNPKPNAEGADTLVDINSAKDAMFRTSVTFHVGEDYAPFVRRIASMFTSYSDLKNAYIERNGTKIPLDIEEYLYDWTKSKIGIAVEANDTLFIPYAQHFEKILVNGEVTSVHEEDAWPLRRISTIIGDNLTAYSSTRNVQITSVDGLTETYDLFKFSRDGDLTQNPYVRAGETVTVQRMERKVTIEGTVERSGTYQLLEGENLKALIGYYGNGLTELADTSRITLTRNRESDDPAGNVIYLDQRAIDTDMVLYNGDRISIGSLADLVPSIIVEGIINNPKPNAEGADTLVEMNTAKDAMFRTSVKFQVGEDYAPLVRRISSMFTSYSDLKNAHVERNGTKISIDIESYLYDWTKSQSGIEVKANDVLVIPYQQHFEKVLVAGEVSNVHEEDAWPLRRLSAIISDNLTPYSSTRNVKVTSVEGVTETFDLFKFSRDGDLTQNPYVRAGETITVQRMERKVTISGAVERPGTYQLLPGENLVDLINYYGHGLAPLADTSRIELTRTLTNEAQSGIKIYLNQENIDSDYQLLCYDSVSIGTYSSLKPVMFMEGALQTSEGTALEASDRVAIRFENGTNYAYLVRSYASYFTATSDIENAYVIRGDKTIPMNLRPMLYDASYYSDMTVEENDTLMIPFKQYFVTVAGAVNNPGRFPYIPDRTWDYYVGLAGGFDRNLNDFEVVDIVDINGKELRKKDPITPETTITASANSFTYFFNKYAPTVTTILSLITTVITIIVAK